jgi:dienelactone hydrolase
MTSITRRRCIAGALLAPAVRAAQPPAPGIDAEIRALAAAAPLAMKFTGTTAAECRAWQQRFSAKLGELLGPYRPPARWTTVRERTVDLADHQRQELVLEAEGERPLPVYLLLPKLSGAVRRPAVLALHGHGEFGYDAVAGVASTPAARAEIDELHYDYGLRLVRRGYVVAAPCLTPFGRRLGDPAAYKKGTDPCAITFVRFMALGKVLIAENLRDVLWAFELLATHPAVDAARLGCVGLSYGGRMTMLTAALEPRIRVAVISGALNVMQERITGRFGCGAQIIPGLLRYGDVPEIASLIAPRPCLWEVGNQDGLMVKEWIPPALERMGRAWRAFGAEDRLEVDRFEGRHQWNGVKALPLLERVLRPDA